jgi:hypothetical protein
VALTVVLILGYPSPLRGPRHLRRSVGGTRRSWRGGASSISADWQSKAGGERLAWVGIDDMRGARLSSLPFSDRADPLVSSADVWKELSNDVFSAGLPFRTLEVSPFLKPE